MSERKSNRTSLAYGLCMKYGIKIMPDWTPRDAWNALYKAKKITPEKAYADHGEKSAERSRTVRLPAKEYAPVCSEIRTLHGNNIQKQGGLLHGNYYYKYEYNKRSKKIICTQKIQIVGNEWLIDKLMRGDFE